MKKYNYLIVGAGLFGCTCAQILAEKGFSVLLIDKREHIGGNIYTKLVDDIVVHQYGAHIFHTSDNEIWEYVNRFASFNNFINSPLANYRGEIYNLPFNMNTFVQLWNDVRTPSDALSHIESEKKKSNITEPKNLEEQAIFLVGETIYKKLIKEYTEKQWGARCTELPAFIIKRIPVRFTFDNNYFDDKYQGIPIGGYTKMMERMLNNDNIHVLLSMDFKQHEKELLDCAEKIIYTGPIDELFDYKYGPLSYRSLRFVSKKINCKFYQNSAVVNYTSKDVPYTRIIEHKHFEFNECDGTIITMEYPEKWSLGKERFYPVNNEENSLLFEKYKKLLDGKKNFYLGGRLGMYRYFDMDDTIAAAFQLIKVILKNEK